MSGEATRQSCMSAMHFVVLVIVLLGLSALLQGCGGEDATNSTNGTNATTKSAAVLQSSADHSSARRENEEREERALAPRGDHGSARVAIAPHGAPSKMRSLGPHYDLASPSEAAAVSLLRRSAGEETGGPWGPPPEVRTGLAAGSGGGPDSRGNLQGSNEEKLNNNRDLLTALKTMVDQDNGGATEGLTRQANALAIRSLQMRQQRLGEEVHELLGGGAYDDTGEYGADPEQEEEDQKSESAAKAKSPKGGGVAKSKSEFPGIGNQNAAKGPKGGSHDEWNHRVLGYVPKPGAKAGGGYSKEEPTSYKSKGSSSLAFSEVAPPSASRGTVAQTMGMEQKSWHGANGMAKGKGRGKGNGGPGPGRDDKNDYMKDGDRVSIEDQRRGEKGKKGGGAMSGDFVTSLKGRIERLEMNQLPFYVNRSSHAVELNNWNLHIHSNSHEHGLGNLVVGLGHNYLGASNSLVAGYHNIANGEAVSVVGGYDNEAKGELTTVGGGHLNYADGLAAAVSGGVENQATGYGASVTGGIDNIASGRGSAVIGGEQNDAVGVGSLSAGGGLNTATNKDSTTGGGYQNSASGPFSDVWGGFRNIASGNGAGVFGGAQSTADSVGKVILGRTGTPQGVRTPDCDPCAKLFAAGGGCRALMAGDVVTVMNLRPPLGSKCAPCASYAEHACMTVHKPSFYHATHCTGCSEDFEKAGGCAAWAKGDWVMLRQLEPKGACAQCAAYAEDHCKSLNLPNVSANAAHGFGAKSRMAMCPQCLAGFENSGGCEAWLRQDWQELIRVAPPQGSPCFICEDLAEERCDVPPELRDSTYRKTGESQWKTKEECEKCNEQFDSAGGCAAWRAGNWAELHKVAPAPGTECYTCEKFAAEHCQIPAELRNEVHVEEDQTVSGMPTKPWGEEAQNGIEKKPAGQVKEPEETSKESPTAPLSDADCAQCVKDFDEQGGCSAWIRGDWDSLNNMKLMKAGSTCNTCKGSAEKHCRIPENHAETITNSALNCGSCVKEFEEKGGCQAWIKQDWKTLDEVKPKQDTPCAPCTPLAEEHCHGREGMVKSNTTDKECKVCALDFANSGGCLAVQYGDTGKIEQISAKKPKCEKCMAVMKSHCTKPTETRPEAEQAAQSEAPDLGAGAAGNPLGGLGAGIRNALEKKLGSSLPDNDPVMSIKAAHAAALGKDMKQVQHISRGTAAQANVRQDAEREGHEQLISHMREDVKRLKIKEAQEAKETKEFEAKEAGQVMQDPHPAVTMPSLDAFAREPKDRKKASSDPQKELQAARATELDAERTAARTERELQHARKTEYQATNP